MRQKIIADKETHEDEVIHNAFEVNLKWNIRNSHLIFQILSKGPNVEKLQNMVKLGKQGPKKTLKKAKKIGGVAAAVYRYTIG